MSTHTALSATPETMQQPFAAMEQAEDEQRRLLRQFGLEEPPPHSFLVVSADRIHIPGEHLIAAQDVNDLAATIGQWWATLQPPGLALAPGSIPDVHHPEATFEAIWGRKRILAHRQLGKPVECKVYHIQCTPELISALALIENLQRSESWRREVADIACLIGRAHLTEDDLMKRYRLKRRLVRQRLALASLPDPLVRLLTTSKEVDLQTALRMTKLQPASLASLSELIEQGQPFSKEMVSDRWFEQLNEGLSSPSLLNVLTEEVEPGSDEESEAEGSDQEGRSPIVSDRLSSVTSSETTQANTLPSIDDLLSSIAAFEQQALPPRVSALLDATKVALRQWQRSQAIAV